MMSHDRAAINQEIIRFILALSYVAVQIATASFTLKPCFALEPCRIAQTVSEPDAQYKASQALNQTADAQEAEHKTNSAEDPRARREKKRAEKNERRFNKACEAELSANSSCLLLSRPHSQLISIPGCADRSIRNGQRL